MSTADLFHTAPTVRVRSGAITLSARTFGKPGAPILFFVHGYPDTSAVWSSVASSLADRYRIVVYDVRGAGASDRPRATEAYRFPSLVADAHAVLDALVPGEKVHLVGHDWGSIQGWELVTSTGSDRFLSFTSISGPCLDHYGWLLREVLGHGRTGAIAAPKSARLRILRTQLGMSWYIAVLTQPKLAATLWRTVLGKTFPLDLERFEGIPRGSGHPQATLAEDGAFGANLYAANMPERARAPRAEPRTSVPVQVVIPEKDRFVSPYVPEVASGFVDSMRVARIDAGHWCVVSRSGEIAGLIDRFVQDLSGGAARAA